MAPTASAASASVTQCETIHLLQLSATPATADNELGVDNSHTVTAHIAGDAAQVSGREVTFVVGGQNGGTTGTCTVNVDCTTDAAGNVSFTYTVPIAPASLGTDTITVTTPIGGNISTVIVEKRWIDTTPPVTACVPGVNPAGHEPKGTNEDGFWRLIATDAVDPNPQIFVIDSGTGTIFGPYPNGTNIKYTQAPGVTPSASPGPGAVEWRSRARATCRLSPWMAPATSRIRCPAWSRRRPSRTRLRSPEAVERMSPRLPVFSSASLGDGRRDPPSIDVAGPRSHDRQRRHHFLQLAVFEKECGIARVAALRLPRGEGLIENATARFHRGSQRRHQRPMEIVEHQHSVAS